MNVSEFLNAIINYLQNYDDRSLQQLDTNNDVL